MPRRTPIALLLAGLLTTSAPAQLSHTPPEARNAALAYSTIFYTELPKDLTDAVEAVELKDVGIESDPAKQPEKFKTALLEVATRQGAVRRLLNTARLDKCDFEIAYEEGFNALLPHLGSMRKSARLLRFDARRALIQNDPDAAAERIAGIYGIARHLKSDDTLISSLVSIAIASLANSESEVLIGSGRLTGIGREKIVAAIDRLGRTDPFGVKDSALGERTITVKWVRERFPAPGSAAKFIECITQEWGMNPEGKQDLVDIAKQSDEDFARSLDRLDEYHTLMQTQWDLPDAPARLEVLAKQITDGDFGPLTKFLAPNFSKARAGQAKAESELDATLKRLKEYKPPAVPATRPN